MTTTGFAPRLARDPSSPDDAWAGVSRAYPQKPADAWADAWRGVQMAISASNTGGAWDNAKKFISGHNMDAVIGEEEPETVKDGKVNTKKSQIFKSAVVGDTVRHPPPSTPQPACPLNTSS